MPGVVVIVAMVMFVFGIMLGSFLHSVLFPQIGPTENDMVGTADAISSQIQPLPDDSYKSVSPLPKQEGCKGFPWKNFRLPRDVIPLSYKLTIHPNLTTHKMTGDVLISVKVLKRTNLIVLHIHNITTTKFNIVVNSRRREAESFVCPVLSQLAFVMDDDVKPGDMVELRIEYNGAVQTDLDGLYISIHTDAHGNQMRSAVTQFEPISAREMFPCFDEPNFKATFELSVVREPQHIVRSNMQVKVSRTRPDGLYIDEFHRSVKMSTYLVAVAILDSFDYAEGTTKNTRNPIKVRLYAPEDVIKGQWRFGLDTAIRALEYFENYFDIPYPLQKIDLLAVDYYGMGAMENWGLVTFIDSLLLQPDGTTNEIVALVICHEISHQWFGNLVTMDWWNDLWLNEGFAKYMEYRCVDHLFPEWNITKKFYKNNVLRSHTVDGLRNSRAISSDDFSHTNIVELFDDISYEKASVILRMLHTLVGEQNFQRALIEYLNTFAYNNARGAQLWEIVEKHAVLPNQISIQSLTNAYINQIGCPMIFVTLNDKEITVHNQTRYFVEDGVREETEWPIPIHYRTDAETDAQLQWMKNRNKVSWPLKKPSKWVVANTGGLSYVKVLYDAKNYEELAKQLRTNHTAIPIIDRLMILVDAFDFSKSSKLGVDVYLDLLLYATEEMDRLAWETIYHQMRYMDDRIEETTCAKLFKDFQLTLILPLYEKFGWSTDRSMTQSQKYLQGEVVSIACHLRHPDCIKQAQHRYKEWISKKSPPPKFLDIVLTESVRQGGVDAWNWAFTSYFETKDPFFKHQLLAAMASTTDSELISRLLRLCLDRMVFRPNVIPTVLSHLSKTSATRAFTWRFFQAKYNDFARVLGDGSELLLRSIKSMISEFSTPEDLEEVKAFLARKRLEHFKSSLNKVFEQIKLSIQWRRVNEQPLRRWLHDWDKNGRTRKQKHSYY